MLCSGCNVERKDSDFLMGNEKCYKCVYEMKLRKIKKVRKCRECQEILCSSKWTYCSDECSKIGWARQKKDYWTNLVKGG